MDELRGDEAVEAVVFAIWPTVLGKQLRERSLAVRFDKAILSVAVPSAEWKREFAEHASEIVYKLNRAFGKSTVERIEIFVDGKAIEAARSGPNERKAEESHTLAAPSSLMKASMNISDQSLRRHFLEAATACIGHREAR